MEPTQTSGSKGALTISRRAILESTAGFTGMMAYLLASGTNSAAQVSEVAKTGKPYDYAKKYLWDIKRVWNKDSAPVSLRDRTARIGAGRIDMDKLVNSPFGEQ